MSAEFAARRSDGCTVIYYSILSLYVSADLQLTAGLTKCIHRLIDLNLRQTTTPVNTFIKHTACSKPLVINLFDTRPPH